MPWSVMLWHSSSPKRSTTDFPIYCHLLTVPLERFQLLSRNSVFRIDIEEFLRVNRELRKHMLGLPIERSRSGGPQRPEDRYCDEWLPKPAEASCNCFSTARSLTVSSFNATRIRIPHSKGTMPGLLKTE